MKLKSPDPLKSWLVCCVVAVKLIMMHNMNSNYFSSLHTNSFALILLLYEYLHGSEFGKTNVHDFFVLPVEFSTIIPRHFRLCKFYQLPPEKKNTAMTAYT